MNPHGFGLVDLFGALCMVLVLGCAAGLLMGLVGMMIDWLTGERGLLSRPRRRG